MPTEVVRWESKVAKTPSCWLWLGATSRGGYGHFRRKVNNSWIMEKAHRFSYEYFYGITRENIKPFVVCHTCDNPSCVNPEHLFLGTIQDNIRDKISKGRHSFGRNKIHNWLSFEIAENIRTFKKQNSKLTYKEIGFLFETSAQQVHRILENQIWKRKVGT